MRLLLLVFLIALPCAADEAATFRRPCMGTVWTVELHAADEKTGQTAANAAFARVEELNGILSDYLKESELSRLSATAGSGKPMTVTGDLFTVLALSQQAATESGGVF